MIVISAAWQLASSGERPELGSVRFTDPRLARSVANVVMSTGMGEVPTVLFTDIYRAI